MYCTTNKTAAKHHIQVLVIIQSLTSGIVLFTIVMQYYLNQIQIKI